MRILRRDIGKLALITFEKEDEPEVGLIISPGSSEGSSPFKEVDVFFPCRKPEYQIDHIEASQIVKFGRRLTATIENKGNNEYIADAFLV